MVTYSAVEESWIKRLNSSEYNQSHLLDNLNEEQTKALIAQVVAADKTYPGGLLNYLHRARQLLADSKNGVNPYAGFTPSEPSTVNIHVGDEEFFELESLGIAQLDKLAFVLVAGGLGERLGYPSIKVGLPVETVTNCTYLQYYCESILAIQRYVLEKTGRVAKCPFAIMTSADTNHSTVELFEKNNWFGMDKSQITIMLQEKVPALLDNDARIAVSKDDPSVLEMKPHGHGDIHTLLKQKGLTRQWVDQGVSHVLFFQDTNALTMRCLVAFLGASVREQFAMNSLTIPRTAGEAVGAVCLLKNSETGTSVTVNVEYNQLEPLLQAAGLGGDVALPETGFSKFPGNCNILMMALKPFAEILNATGGAVPEFVNPKYADATKTKFKSPTRVECMMQEFARLFKPDQKVGCTQMDRWFCFSPVKNNLADAAVKAKNGIPSECCLSGETDYYTNTLKCLSLAAEKAGAKICFGKANDVVLGGVAGSIGARVIAKPSWACCVTEMSERLKDSGCSTISEKSILILENNCKFNNLELDGALHLKGVLHKCCPLRVCDLKLANKGYEISLVKEDDSDAMLVHKVRGYKHTKIEETRICC